MIDNLLAPLSSTPKIARFEIALHVDTGNTIYAEFSDYEEAMAFISDFAQNPHLILDKITPRIQGKD